MPRVDRHLMEDYHLIVKPSLNFALHFQPKVHHCLHFLQYQKEWHRVGSRTHVYDSFLVQHSELDVLHSRL